MAKSRLKLKIDWSSKILDLLIVIIGITIAFRLNNWNESRKTNTEIKSYIKSFYDENKENQKDLVDAIKLLKLKVKDVDSLKQILVSKDYSDKRIRNLVASMSSEIDFSPSTITMQNINASGKFDQIGSFELRKDITSTYDAYKTSNQLESLLAKYGSQYVSPFFFRNVRFSNFKPIHSNFIENPLFENIVIGYDVLLNQLLKGYEANLKRVNSLNKKLAVAEK